MSDKPIRLDTTLASPADQLFPTLTPAQIARIAATAPASPHGRSLSPPAPSIGNLRSRTCRSLKARACTTPRLSWRRSYALMKTS